MLDTTRHQTKLLNIRVCAAAVRCSQIQAGHKYGHLDNLMLSSPGDAARTGSFICSKDVVAKGPAGISIGLLQEPVTMVLRLSLRCVQHGLQHVAINDSMHTGSAMHTSIITFCLNLFILSARCITTLASRTATSCGYPASTGQWRFCRKAPWPLFLCTIVAF